MASKTLTPVGIPVPEHKPATLPPLENKTLSKVAQEMANEHYDRSATQHRAPQRKPQQRDPEPVSVETKEADPQTAPKGDGRLPSITPDGGEHSPIRIRSVSPSSPLVDPEDLEIAPFQAFEEAGLDHLQRLWEEHEAAMDKTGENFVEQFEKTHTATLQAMARIKDFDLKAVLAQMQEHALAVRSLVMNNYQYTRHLEGNFASTLYGTAKETYEVGIRTLLDRTNSHHRDKMRAIRLSNGEQLQRERVGAREEQKAALKQQHAAVRQALQEKFDADRDVILGEKGQVELQAEELRGKLENDVHEISMLKQEIASQSKELKLSRAWKVKAEQEKERAEALAKEKTSMTAAHEKMVAQMDQNARLEMTRRDREIERLRNTVMQMEAELKDFHNDPNITHIRVDRNVEGGKDSKGRASVSIGAGEMGGRGTRIKSTSNQPGQTKAFRTGRSSKVDTSSSKGAPSPVP